ncbi:MAG: ROK family protein [Spirochaetota bacterium]
MPPALHAAPAPARRRAGFISNTLAAVIQRADELSEFLSIYWKEGKCPLSKQIKLGLAKAFQKFSEYDLAKYNRKKDIMLRDVLFLCHAKPADVDPWNPKWDKAARKVHASLADNKAGRWYRENIRPEGATEGELLYGKLVYDQLATPDTWEVELSQSTNKRESWMRLIEEKKLGDLAFLRNLRNMLFIEIGNGVGAGIILDGNLYRGTQGAAGEIGYFISEPAGLGYDSSKGGYLETRASLSAFRLPGVKAERAETGRLAASLFEAAGRGDEEALRIIADAIRHLAVTIVNIMILLNPELVILGGAAFELPRADSLLIEPLIEEVRRNYPFSPTSIRSASLGTKASLMGAVQLALDSLVVHAYPYRL